MDNNQHIGLYGDNGSSLISDNIKVISCDDSYIDKLRLIRRKRDIMFDADHHNLCLGINGKYKIIKYHGNMKIYERDIIIKDIRTIAGDWFEYEIEY